jgi:hypothetical protein
MIDFFLLRTRNEFNFVRFYSTELLEAVGVLDDLVTNEQSETAENLKQRLLGKVSDIRSAVRSRFDSDNIKEWMATDRMLTLGAAVGAMCGFLL